MNYNIERYILAPTETDYFTPLTVCSRGTFTPSGFPQHDLMTFSTREDFALFLERGISCVSGPGAEYRYEKVKEIMEENPCY